MIQPRERSGHGDEAPSRAGDGREAPGWVREASLIVLSGGSSRRLGRDKATTYVGGSTVLDRILGQVPSDLPVVLVGPAVPELPSRVRVVRETPPGGGPLAGIGAGLAEVGTPLVGVLAADMPFAVELVQQVTTSLSRSDPSVDALLPVDLEGHRQPLAAAYRTEALRPALRALSPLAGRPMRALLATLRVVEWPTSGEKLIDIDTPGELRAARDRAAQEGRPMEEWLTAVREALGLDVDLDVDTILDVARDAAHHVERPAAPLTTYLLGAAVARGADPREAAATINGLAVGWADQPQ